MSTYNALSLYSISFPSFLFRQYLTAPTKGRPLLGSFVSHRNPLISLMFILINLAKKFRFPIPMQRYFIQPSPVNALIKNQIPNALIVRLRWAFLSHETLEAFVVR